MAQSVTTSGPIPAELAGRSTNKNLKFIVGGFLLIGIVIFLIVQATMSTGAYYLTVTEIQESNGALVGQRVRASGQVVDGSEDWDPQSIPCASRLPTTRAHNCQLSSLARGPTISSVLLRP
jgi:hypothetical protein